MTNHIDANWRSHAPSIHIHIDLADTTPAPAPPRNDSLRRQHDRLQAQIVRINDWCAEHAPDEYHSDGDTADAMIAAADRLRGRETVLSAHLATMETRLDAARLELAQAVAERDEAQQTLLDIETWLAMISPSHLADLAAGRLTLAQAIEQAHNAAILLLDTEVNALRSFAIATPHGNGKTYPTAVLSALEAAAQGEDLPEQYPPAIVAATEAAQTAPVEQTAPVQITDDPELHDYIIGLDTGRHTWRTIPNPQSAKAREYARL